MPIENQINYDEIFRLYSDTASKNIQSTKNKSIYEYINNLSNFMMQKDPKVDKTWPFDQTWVDNIANNSDKPGMSRKMKIWLNVAINRHRAFYLLYLANKNFGATREFIRYLVNSKQPLPDLEYFINNICNVYYGESPKPRLRKVFEEGFDPDSDPGCRLIRTLVSTEEEFTKALTDPRIDIKAMGGWRNMMIGADNNNTSGIELWKDSDIFYDLGGGHSTPWVEQAFDRKFTSLDIVKPDDIKNVTLRKMTKRKRKLYPVDLDEKESKEYLELLKNQNYKTFNIYENSLDLSHKKITIYSAGFLTGVMPLPANILEKFAESEYGKNRKLNIREQAKISNMIGLLKCLEPVFHGVDVELFSISRASGYPMKLQVVHLRWESGKVTYKFIKEKNNKYLSLESKKKKHLLLSGDPSISNLLKD